MKNVSQCSRVRIYCPASATTGSSPDALRAGIKPNTSPVTTAQANALPTTQPTTSETVAIRLSNQGKMGAGELAPGGSFCRKRC